MNTIYDETLEAFYKKNTGFLFLSVFHLIKTHFQERFFEWKNTQYKNLALQKLGILTRLLIQYIYFFSKDFKCKPVKKVQYY